MLCNSFALPLLLLRLAGSSGTSPCIITCKSSKVIKYCIHYNNVLQLFLLPPVPNGSILYLSFVHHLHYPTNLKYKYAYIKDTFRLNLRVAILLFCLTVIFMFWNHKSFILCFQKALKSNGFQTSIHHCTVPFPKMCCFCFCNYELWLCASSNSLSVVINTHKNQ